MAPFIEQTEEKKFDFQNFINQCSQALLSIKGEARSPEQISQTLESFKALTESNIILLTSENSASYEKMLRLYSVQLETPVLFSGSKKPNDARRNEIQNRCRALIQTTSNLWEAAHAEIPLLKNLLLPFFSSLPSKEKCFRYQLAMSYLQGESALFELTQQTILLHAVYMDWSRIMQDKGTTDFSTFTETHRGNFFDFRLSMLEPTSSSLTSASSDLFFLYFIGHFLFVESQKDGTIDFFKDLPFLKKVSTFLQCRESIEASGLPHLTIYLYYFQYRLAFLQYSTSSDSFNSLFHFWELARQSSGDAGKYHFLQNEFKRLGGNRPATRPPPLLSPKNIQNFKAFVSVLEIESSFGNCLLDVAKRGIETKEEIFLYDLEKEVIAAYQLSNEKRQNLYSLLYKGLQGELKKLSSSQQKEYSVDLSKLECPSLPPTLAPITQNPPLSPHEYLNLLITRLEKAQAPQAVFEKKEEPLPPIYRQKRIPQQEKKKERQPSRRHRKPMQLSQQASLQEPSQAEGKKPKEPKAQKGMSPSPVSSLTPPLPGRAPFFSYHPRVTRWFTCQPDQPLNSTLFSEYNESVLGYQKKMIELHGFSPLADRFYDIGFEIVRQNPASNTSELLFIVAGELETGKGVERGAICWCVDPKTEICYHRFFHKISDQNELIQNMVHKTFQAADFPELSSNVEEPTKRSLPFAAGEDQITIDSLNIITILDQRLGATLRLYPTHRFTAS